MSDGLSDGEPPAIDPYEVLGLNRTASADQVKTAYRKAALKWHPDKVAARHSGEDADTVSAKKTEAHTRFQEVALAYAVLSDAARRKRYDETGSTAESVVDADGFSWSDFYRAAFADAVSADAIEKFAAAYKGSAEERTDLLSAYTANKGRMDGVYEGVMLSNVLEDDARFRSIIDAAVAAGEVQAYAAYRRETASTRRARAAAAKREASEAEEYARELGVHEKLFGVKGDREGEDEEKSEETAKGNGDKSKGKGKGKAKGGKGGKDDIDTGLAALIQQRQKHRAASFLDNLATKFGAVPPPGSTKSKNKAKRGKKRPSPSGDDIDDNNDNGEPSEEAFQAAAARLKNGTKKARR